METLFDPLFHVPWVTGGILSLSLPLIGLYLRLRDEWLAALGLAQMAAAAGLIGHGLGLPIMLSGTVGGLLMALLKHFTLAGNTAYALMIISGWSITFLAAANTPLGESLGRALMDGQLYFVQWPSALAALIILVIGAGFLCWASPRLLRARLFPHFEQLNETNSYRWHLGFDITVAITMAVATASIGLMTAFAMIFIPAWLAFKIAKGWRNACLLAVLFNAASYVLGFALAVLFDQPYGPTQTAVHLLGAGVILAGHNLFTMQTDVFKPR